MPADLAHPDFEGRSGHGVWADVLTEVDHRAGQVLDAVDELGQRDNTIVIWMSENGAEPEEAPGGLVRPVTGAATTSPRWRFICGHLPGVRFPAGLPPGQERCHGAYHRCGANARGCSGLKMPTDRVIDGVNQLPLLSRVRRRTARARAFRSKRRRDVRLPWRHFKGISSSRTACSIRPCATIFPVSTICCGTQRNCTGYPVATTDRGPE